LTLSTACLSATSDSDKYYITLTHKNQSYNLGMLQKEKVETVNLSHSLILLPGMKLSITGGEKGDVAVTGFFEGEENDEQEAKPRKASVDKNLSNGKNGVKHEKTQEKKQPKQEHKPAHKLSSDSKDGKKPAQEKSKKPVAEDEDDLVEDFDSDELQAPKKGKKSTPEDDESGEELLADEDDDMEDDDLDGDDEDIFDGVDDDDEDSDKKDINKFLGKKNQPFSNSKKK